MRTNHITCALALLALVACQTSNKDVALTSNTKPDTAQTPETDNDTGADQGVSMETTASITDNDAAPDAIATLPESSVPGAAAGIRNL